MVEITAMDYNPSTDETEVIISETEEQGIVKGYIPYGETKEVYQDEIIMVDYEDDYEEVPYWDR